MSKRAKIAMRTSARFSPSNSSLLAILALLLLVSCVPTTCEQPQARPPSTRRTPGSSNQLRTPTVPLRQASTSGSKAPRVQCVPVYMQGSCPVGCAPLKIEPMPGLGSRIEVCNFSHRVHKVSHEDGSQTVFLIPLPPAGLKYVGPMCSAAKPHHLRCAGKCASGCTTGELRRFFGKPR